MYIYKRQLCNSCDCDDQSSCSCLDYAQLWDTFLQHYLVGGYTAPTKDGLPAALNDWATWGANQDDLTEQQQELCFGPQRKLQQFDSATIAEAKFVASRVEGAKFARDSLGLMHNDGQYHAGRVRAFLSHPAPGWEDCNSEDEANIAEIDWFAPATAASGIEGQMCTDLGCPVFKREFKDDHTGNLCPLERLAPCKLISLPHKSHIDNLVVVSRFASFLDMVPKGS